MLFEIRQAEAIQVIRWQKCWASPWCEVTAPSGAREQEEKRTRLMMLGGGGGAEPRLVFSLEIPTCCLSD